jgi:pentatricopeptide repeat protein
LFYMKLSSMPFESFQHLILHSAYYFFIIFQVGVLAACSHNGLLGRGTEYFYSMSKDYGISPNSKHYTYMIDLLG